MHPKAQPSKLTFTNPTQRSRKSPRGSSTPPNPPRAAGFPFHRPANPEVVFMSHLSPALPAASPHLPVQPVLLPQSSWAGIEAHGHPGSCFGLFAPSWGRDVPSSLFNELSKTWQHPSPGRFCLSPKHPRLPLGMNRGVLTFLMGNLGKSGHKIHPMAPEPLPTAPGLAPTRGHCKTHF